MKKWLKMLFCTLLAVVSCGLISFATTRLQASAETTDGTETTVTEAAYAQVWVNDLGGFTHEGATYNAQTNSVDLLPSGCRFGYDSGFENVEVKSKVTFVTKGSGNINFFLRMQGDLKNNSYTRRGYQFRWYATGQYEVLKNGTKILGVKWTTTPAAGSTYTVTFSTINQSDGSVKIKALIGTKQVFEYVDATDPVLGGGMYAMTSDGSQLSVTGEGFADKPINLYDMASPVTNANFPSTSISEDGKVTLTSGGVAGGAAWGFQQTDFYSYAFKYTPTTADGKLRMTFGSQGTLHRDDIIGDSGWNDTGYVLQWWGGNGQRHLYRNNKLLEYVWNLPTFVAGQTYEIEYGVTSFGDGSNRVHLKIDGALKMIYFDRPSETNTPLAFTKTGVPGSLFRYALISGIGANGVIEPIAEKTQYDEKTLLNSQLGTPATHSAATFDRNGGITEMSSGRNAGYNGDFLNTSIKMKGNFTATGSMILQLRGQSTVFDTPWGGSWTNKGYAVYLYANGQTILTKNGATLCEGWSLSSKKIATNTDYVIEFGTVNVGENAVRVFAKIDGSYVVNYLDNNNALTNSGWFTIFNNSGFAGSLMPYGVTYPEISTDLAEGKQALVNVPVTLSVTGTSETDEITYYVDETKSTVEATVWGDQLTAKGAGEVVVYACVNGIYGNELTISVKEPATPQIVGAPSTIVFGSQNVVLDVKLSDDGEITSKAFFVEDMTGSATINAETGEITPVKAGTVKVYAVVNDTRTTDVIITIVPVVTVTAPSATIYKGNELILQYTTNCPTEDVTARWQLVEGEGVASLNAETGELTAIEAGTFSVKVTLTSESFRVDSEALVLQVVVPVLTNLPTTHISLNGAPWTVGVKLSNDGEITSKIFYVEDVTGSATIDAETGAITPVKAGTVRVYAVVNGVETERVTITIAPAVSVATPSAMIFKGDVITLEYTTDGPTEEVTARWQLVEGEGVVSLNTETGELTAIEAGTFSVKVILTAQSFEVESLPLTLQVVVPVLTNLPEAPIIVGGEVWSVDAKLSNDGEITSKAFFVEDVSGSATIDEQTGAITPVKAGTVRVYAVVNGVETERVLLTMNPKVFLHKTGSFAFTGVYDLNEYYSANCELPDEEIMVVFEMVSGGEYATLDAQTGVLTVGSMPGIVSLKVYVTGETFQAVSAVTSISVEKPIIIVQDSFLGDLFVGQSVTLTPSVSQGGIEIVKAEILAIEGSDCVTIEGTTITAVKAGTLKYQVVINDTLIDQDEALEIAIEELVSTIIASEEMYIGQTQQAELMFNADDYTYTEAVWSVVEGGDVLMVSESGMIAALTTGTATLRVVVDGISEMQLTINVYGRIVLLGVAQDAQVFVDSIVQLSYRIIDESIGEVETVEYVVTKGANCISIAEDGTLTAVEKGDVELKVVINGAESQVLQFTVIADEDIDGGDNGDGTTSSNSGIFFFNCFNTVAFEGLYAVLGAAAACLFIGKKKNED
ncbi:MAG: hypothetical protein J6D30_00340 [Clostridia bacterium]|nr:hypothetical protein [Clostridia bacterium]